jgi:hypothetical protein
MITPSGEQPLDPDGTPRSALRGILEILERLYSGESTFDDNSTGSFVVEDTIEAYVDRNFIVRGGETQTPSRSSADDHHEAPPGQVDPVRPCDSARNGGRVGALSMASCPATSAGDRLRSRQAGLDELANSEIVSKGRKDGRSTQPHTTRSRIE